MTTVRNSHTNFGQSTPNPAYSFLPKAWGLYIAGIPVKGWDKRATGAYRLCGAHYGFQISYGFSSSGARAFMTDNFVTPMLLR